MTWLNKTVYLLPLLIIVLEIVFLKNYHLNPTLNPVSPKNNFVNEVSLLLRTAELSPLKITLHDYQHELEFYLKNQSGTAFNVILSTQKSPLSQVAALQKVIKIANIKGKDIHFIDLSGESPYATL